MTRKSIGALIKFIRTTILFDIKTEKKPRGGRAASLRGGHRLKGSEALTRREFGAFSPFRGESGREEAFSGPFLGRESP